MTFDEKLKEGLRLINVDNYPQALHVLGEAYIINPYNQEVLKGIAFLWQRINDGNYDLIPETAEQFIMRGNSRLYRSEFVGAYKDYSQAIALDGKCDFAYKCRGFVKALQGKHDEAHKDYSFAIKLNPTRGEYWDDAATSFEAMGDTFQAHLCHESAVKNSPNDARLWYNYAVFFVDYLQDIDSALEKLNKALEIWPEFEDALVNKKHLLELKRKLK